MYQVELYADGACSHNPGFAGIGIVLKWHEHRKEVSKPIGIATNNVAEMRAVIEGLKLLRAPEQTEITLYTDSQLVEGFLVNGWTPKLNQDLVEEMKALLKACHSFTVVKVKGHNGMPDNEVCHRLAHGAAQDAVAQCPSSLK
jgi:ribonuclease HI